MIKNNKQKRKQKKKKRSTNGSTINWSEVFSNPVKAQSELSVLFNSKKLTTPKMVNEDIESFCKEISHFEPVFIEVTPEKWSRLSCCDLNVMKYIEGNGGNIVCGDKIWYHDPMYIEAERHAVWEINGVYRDITHNADGEKQILFLPDVKENQDILDKNKVKFRWGKNAKTKALIDVQENVEALTHVNRMSNEESWNLMPTYEQWLEESKNG